MTHHRRSETVHTSHSLHHGVCFVCGAAGPIEGLIQIKELPNGGPYFPFLEHHEPPKSSRRMKSDAVEACRICHSFLMGQWDSFERSKTPAIKRLYWLKRADDEQFNGIDVKIQGEYAAQIIGLQYNPSPYDMDHSLISPQSDSVPLLAPPKKATPSPKYDRETSKYGYPANDDALDLSAAACTKHSKGSQSHSSTEKKANKSQQTNKGRKEGNFICFLCHSDTPSAQEAQLFASSVVSSGQPYFPFLIKMNPPRGGRCLSSRGTVQVCTPCESLLHAQWEQYEQRKITQDDRMYHVGNLTFGTSQSATTGVSGYLHEWPHHANKNMLRNHSLGVESLKEDTCYLCAEKTKKSLLKCLNTTKSDSQDNLPFYPFITQIVQSRHGYAIDKIGRVLACTACSAYLESQWHLFESTAVPQQNRQYKLRSAQKVYNESEVRSDVSDKQAAKKLGTTSDTRAAASTSEESSVHTITSPQQTSNVQSLLKSHPSNRSSRVKPDERKTEADTYCYICNFICTPVSYKIHSQYSQQHMPFFPSLSDYRRAPLAADMTSAGQVNVCKLCYLDLIQQWMLHENKLSKSERESATKLTYKTRHYTFGEYSCFVCAMKKIARTEASLISITKFPFLRKSPFPEDCLTLCDLDIALVCHTCHTSLTSQYEVYISGSVPSQQRQYRWINHNDQKQYTSLCVKDTTQTRLVVDVSIVKEEFNAEHQVKTPSSTNDKNVAHGLNNEQEISIGKPEHSSDSGRGFQPYRSKNPTEHETISNIASPAQSVMTTASLHSAVITAMANQQSLLHRGTLPPYAYRFDDPYRLMQTSLMTYPSLLGHPGLDPGAHRGLHPSTHPAINPGTHSGIHPGLVSYPAELLDQHRKLMSPSDATKESRPSPHLDRGVALDRSFPQGSNLTRSSPSVHDTNGSVLHRSSPGLTKLTSTTASQHKPDKHSQFVHKQLLHQDRLHELPISSDNKRTIDYHTFHRPFENSPDHRTDSVKRESAPHSVERHSSNKRMRPDTSNTPSSRLCLVSDDHDVNDVNDVNPQESALPDARSNALPTDISRASINAADFEQQAEFLWSLRMLPVRSEQRREMDLIRQACNEDKSRREKKYRSEESVDCTSDGCTEATLQQLTKPSITQSSTLLSVVTSTHPPPIDSPPIDPPITIQTNHPVAEQSMKSFTEEFHQSVLEQTKQQLLCDVPTDDSYAESDVNVHSSILSIDRSHPPFNDSYTWPGVEAVMESYQKHLKERSLEHGVLREQCEHLQNQNAVQLRQIEQYKHTLSSLMHNSQLLEGEKHALLLSLENLKTAILGLQ